MTTSLHVRARADSSSDYEIRDDNQVVTRYAKIPNKWDFARCIPPRRWELSKRDEQVYALILSTAEGRDALNLLKNDKANSIINQFIEEEKEKILTRKGAKLTRLGALFKGILETPIKSLPTSPPTKLLGITKKQIWQQFFELGLVTKYRKKINS